VLHSQSEETQSQTPQTEESIPNPVQNGMDRILNTPYMLANVHDVKHRHIKIGDDSLIDFANCGYLGLDSDIHDFDIQLARKWGLRNGWSRISGSTSLTRLLEENLEQAMGFDCVRLAQSISLINLSIFYSLSRTFPLWFADTDVHITLKHGMRAGAGEKVSLRYWRNNNLTFLERLLSRADRTTPKLIVVDGIYSMKGTTAPIKELVRLGKTYNAWVLIDDAHGFGVVGDRGYGVVDGLSPQELERVLYIGSFSKCASNPVGFLGFHSAFAKLFDSSAPCLIYSGPPSNFHVAACIRHLNSFIREPLGEKRRMVAAYSKDIHSFCAKNKIGTISESGCPIIGVRIEPEAMEAIVQNLFDHGIFAKPAVFPVVRKGDEIIRFTVSAAHTTSDIKALKRAIISTKGWKYE
jgi:8-amino-7-oxononanoate synthase